MVGGLWGVVGDIIGDIIGDIMGVRGLLIWKDDTTSSMWRRVEYILTFFVISVSDQDDLFTIYTCILVL